MLYGIFSKPPILTNYLPAISVFHLSFRNLSKIVFNESQILGIALHRMQVSILFFIYCCPIVLGVFCV